MYYPTSLLLLPVLALRHLTAASPIAEASADVDSVLNERAEFGPVLASNFPDPSIIWVNGYWYSFATTNGVVNIQIARSQDFVTWTQINYHNGSQRDALPSIPMWVNGTAANTWAPDVIMLVSVFASTIIQRTSNTLRARVTAVS